MSVTYDPNMSFAAGREGSVSDEASLETMDTIGGILAAIMTLGPLAATAFIGL